MTPANALMRRPQNCLRRGEETEMDATPQPLKTTVVLVLAWTAVLAPFAWGIAKTFLNSLALFR